MKLLALSFVAIGLYAQSSVVHYQAGQPIDFSGASAVKVPTASAGDNTTNAANTAFVKTGLTSANTWQKVTVTFSQLTTAGLTQTINLISTTARTKVCGVSIKTSTAFSGGLIASLTVSVGDAAGNGLDYAPAFTVLSAVSNTNYQDTIPATVASKTSAASTITALFTSTVGNLNTATAGSVDIDVCTVVIP